MYVSAKPHDLGHLDFSYILVKLHHIVWQVSVSCWHIPIGDFIWVPAGCVKRWFEELLHCKQRLSDNCIQWVSISPLNPVWASTKSRNNLTTWNFIYIYILLLLLLLLLFLAVLVLCCCAGFSLIAASGGYSLAVVPGLLIVLASLLAEHQH